MERVVGGVTAVTVGRDVGGRVLGDVSGATVILCQPGSVDHARRLAAAGGDLPVRVLPDADDAKTLATVESVVPWLLDSGVRRDGLVVAVGGGGLLDAAGFIASVYLRGIEARSLPTTLLGAVDASIGGKNGINVAGKNLVGTFTHPTRVVVDLDIIEANPPALLADGLSEALKAGAIGDPVLFAEIERNGLEADLVTVVERAISVKADVVDADFTEQGMRAVLNFGHTVGHAVEYLSGWTHGQSVAVGMMAAAAASATITGFDATGRLQDAIEAVGLPVSAPGLDRAEVLHLIDKDKKADAAGVRMVLLEAIGRPVVSHVDSATLNAALAAIGIGGT